MSKRRRDEAEALQQAKTCLIAMLASGVAPTHRSYTRYAPRYDAPSLRWFLRSKRKFSTVVAEAVAEYNKMSPVERAAVAFARPDEQEAYPEIAEALARARAAEAERYPQTVQALDHTFRVEEFEVRMRDGSIVRVRRERVSLR